MASNTHAREPDWRGGVHSPTSRRPTPCRAPCHGMIFNGIQAVGTRCPGQGSLAIDLLQPATLAKVGVAAK